MLDYIVVVNRRSHRYASFLRLVLETIILHEYGRNLLFVVLKCMKVWEREQMIREEGMEAGMEAGIAAGKAEQEKETEKERQRAQKEQQRAEKAEQEVAELRRKLEELQKQR